MFTCQSATGLHLIGQFLFSRTDIDQIAGKAHTIFLAYVSRRQWSTQKRETIDSTMHDYSDLLARGTEKRSLHLIYFAILLTSLVHATWYSFSLVSPLLRGCDSRSFFE